MSYFDTIYADTLLPHRAIPVYMYLKDRSGSTVFGSGKNSHYGPGKISQM